MPSLFRSAAWRCRIGRLGAGSRRGLAALTETFGFVHVVRVDAGLVHASKGDLLGVDGAAGVHIRAMVWPEHIAGGRVMASLDEIVCICDRRRGGF